MRKFISIASWLLLIGGAIFIWRGGSDYWRSVSSQKEEALAWDNQNVDEVGRPSIGGHGSDESPVKASTRQANLATGIPGASIAKLSIPRLSSVLYVLEGTDDQDLKRGPGHLEGTVMPGAVGNCVIAGHRDTHFRVLKDVAKGDEIVVQSHKGTYKYRVSGISVVTPDNVDSLQPTSNSVLNLITCFPFDYVGSAPRRFIVHADLIRS